MRRHRLVAPVLAAALAGALGLGACGGDDTGSRATGTDDGAIEYPTGADDVVVRVERVGGFGVGPAAIDQPVVTVYGDGTVIVPGPQIEIYPPPALPNLLFTTVDDDDIADLLERADELDLLRPDVDYGEPNVTDQAETVVTITGDGETYEHTAYALDFGGGARGGNLTEEQLEARARLDTFIEIATGDDTLGDDALGQYQTEALAVISEPYSAPNGPERTKPNTIEWPLGDLATAGSAFELGSRCFTVSGPALDPALELADRATTITKWTSGGASYSLTLVPLLPDEPGCDALIPG